MHICWGLKKTRMIHKILLGILFLFFCFSPAKAQGIKQIEVSKSIENKIDSIFKEYDNPATPGLSVGFMQNGKLIFSKGYGMADLEHNNPIDTSSVFSLASVSKQFTVFAILLLEQQGKLSLNDNVRKHIPKFNNYSETVTLQQLANHSSGIRSQLQLLGQAGYISDNVITKEDALKIIYDQEELNFKPGSEFSYSNSGYVLLAEVVEKVSGRPFSLFMKENVFEPLAMNNSFVMDDYHKIIKNRANSYEIENGTYVNAPANYSYYGSTGLYTTLIDLKKWASNFSNPKIGNRDLFEKMNTLAVLKNGKNYGYALGQFVGDFNGLKQIYHSGGDAGYRAFFGRFPEQNVAVLLLSNNNTVDAQSKALEMVDIFLKPYYKSNSTTQPISSKPKIIQLEVLDLKKFSGSYLNPNNYIIRKIFVRNDTLIYSRQDQDGRETPLLALNKENTFQLGDSEKVQAFFSKSGTIESISILVGGEKVEFYSKYLPKKYPTKELEEFVGTFYSKELDTKYILETKNGILTVSHPKMNLITLQPIKLDSFLGSSWQFRSLEFDRNEKNKIKGFRISSGRVKNVRFEKIAHNLHQK